MRGTGIDSDVEIKRRFLLFVMPQLRCVPNHALPRSDSNCADGFAVFILAYAAASAFVAC
jgi:hypothetical protein